MVTERQTVDELIRYEETQELIMTAIKNQDAIALLAAISIGHKANTCWKCGGSATLIAVNVTYVKLGISGVSEIYQCENCHRQMSTRFHNPEFNDKASLSVYFPVKDGKNNG